MLDEHHIQLIKKNREQITRHRLEDVLLHKRVAGKKDPFTGDTKYTESKVPAEGTWKTLISQSGGEGEIQFDNGVHVVTDDVILDLDISVDFDGVTKVTRVRTGDVYTVKAHDIIGLGEPNRHYILLELVK